MASTPFPLISCSNLPKHKLFLSTSASSPSPSSSSSSVLRTSPYSSSCDPRRPLSSHSSSASGYGGGGGDDDDDLLRAHVLASLPNAAPQAMTAPMRSAVAAAPATIAPHLCAAACALLGGGGGDLAGELARAIALSRAGLHAHVAGCGRANLLAGCALLPLGFEILARALGGGSSERAHRAALRAVVEVAEAMGASRGAVGGHGMEAEGVGEEEAERVVERTDGRVGECAAACGAAAAAAAAGGGGAAAEEVVGRVRRFGYYAGMMDGMLRRGAAEAAAEYKERALAEVAGGGFDAAAAAAARAMVEAWYEARVAGGLGLGVA